MKDVTNPVSLPEIFFLGGGGEGGNCPFHAFSLIIQSSTIFYLGYSIGRGPGSVVGIATDYGLDGPEIESRWRRDFPHLSRPALGPTQPPVQWVPGLSRG